MSRYSNFLDMYRLVLFGCFLGTCVAHMCLVTPQQRGALPKSLNNSDDIAAPECYMRTAPCGGHMAANMTYGVKRGHNLNVTINKNLNHYNKQNPGIFEVNLIKETSPITVVASAKLSDDNKPSLTNYTITVPVPSNVHDHRLVVQVIYKSNAHGLTFYQCSDISVH